MRGRKWGPPDRKRRPLGEIDFHEQAVVGLRHERGIRQLSVVPNEIVGVPVKLKEIIIVNIN